MRLILGHLIFKFCRDFQTSRAFVKGYFYVSLGISYASEAKLVLAINAIRYADRYGWNKIWLESDLTYVVTLFRTRSYLVSWNWLPSWTNCFARISHMEFHYSYICQKGNWTIDSLASRFPIFCSTTWWWDVTSFTCHFF